MIKQRIIRERPASVLAHIHSNAVIHVYLGVYIRPEIDLNARTKVYICNNRKTRAKTWHHCKSIFAIYICCLMLQKCTGQGNGRTIQKSPQYKT